MKKSVFLTLCTGLCLLPLAGLVHGEEFPLFTAYDDVFYRIFPADTAVDIVVDSERDGKALRMVEGPSWSGDTLFFSDQPGGFHSLRPDGNWSLINEGGWTCGTAALKNGNLAVCQVDSCAVVEMTPDGRIIGTLADTVAGAPFFGNPNDLAVDSNGGIYITLSPFFGRDVEKNTALIYRKAGGETVLVSAVNEFGFTNGCALSSDGRIFYLTDSRVFTVWAFDVEGGGILSNKRPFATLEAPPGTAKPEPGKMSGADGLSCDSAGNVYVTSKYGLHVFASDGDALGLVTFHDQPSNCVFGGNDMRTLFVTCKTKIYAIRTNVSG